MRRHGVNRSGLQRWAPSAGTINAREDAESRSTSITMTCDMTAERKPSTIDDYLKRVPEDRRRALEDLRAKIRSIVPDAEECISYRIPAFRVNGVAVAGFWSRHTRRIALPLSLRKSALKSGCSRPVS